MKAIIKDVMTNLNNEPKRLLHVIQTGLIAKAIAFHYGFDEKEAFLAGVMHDYSKHESISFHEKWLSKEDINKCKNQKYLYHAHSAANYFKSRYQINERLYRAIKNHVYGYPKMDKLTQILFISDSIYFNNFKLYKEALLNLDEATYLVCLENSNNLVRRGMTVAKEQQLTYNYYKGVRL